MRFFRWAWVSQKSVYGWECRTSALVKQFVNDISTIAKMLPLAIFGSDNSWTKIDAISRMQLINTCCGKGCPVNTVLMVTKWSRGCCAAFLFQRSTECTALKWRFVWKKAGVAMHAKRRGVSPWKIENHADLVCLVPFVFYLWVWSTAVCQLVPSLASLLLIFVFFFFSMFYLHSLLCQVVIFFTFAYHTGNLS